jgi:AbiV family abortive infection protein
VDLKAVKEATGRQLVAFAVAATANARSLLNDAQLLAAAHCWPRAYSLSALAVEECGKAAALVTLAAMPGAVRSQAPTGRMLEWHQLKQVGGMLIGAVSYSSPGAAPRLAAMDAADLAQILCALEQPAHEADRLKRRGFYVDMDRDGRIQGPSDITRTEVASQLATAEQAVSSSITLLDPAVQDRMANPPAEAVEFSCAMLSALTEADGRSPKAAAEVMSKAVRELRDRMAVIDAEGRPNPGG